MAEVSKLGSLIGAEVLGLDIAKGITEVEFSTVETALTEFAVVVIREQDISPEEQLRFARKFGQLEINAFAKYSLEDYPGILKVSNIQNDGKDIGYADAGSFWHTDMSYTKTPPRLTMLYALEIPSRDNQSLGDTLFASATDAYDSLSSEMKQKVSDLKAIHDFSAKKRGVKKPVTVTADQIEKNPPVEHPVIRTHPISGRKAIYVTADECTGIVGWDDADAGPLIEYLSDKVVEPQFQYRHRWREGDLLIWDNCAVQHVVDRNYQFPPDRRLLHRCTVNGSAPV